MGPLMFISVHTDHLNADKLEKQLSGLSPNYVQVRTQTCCMSIITYISKAESEQQVSQKSLDPAKEHNSNT